jgi:preprotein translocase subunit SecG
LFISELFAMVTFFSVLLTVLAILSGILMIVVIMLQNNKGGGGLGAVSGGITETMFGASAANVLVKITIWLAVLFMGSTLVLATLTGRVRGGKSIAETMLPEESTSSLVETAPLTETAQEETPTVESQTEAPAVESQTEAPEAAQ